MKFSSVSKSTYRRATGSWVESDRDQNPVKIYLSRSSRSFNERDTTVGIQFNFCTNFISIFEIFETQYIIFLRWALSLIGKPPLVSVERMYSGAEMRSFMGEYR